MQKWEYCLLIYTASMPLIKAELYLLVNGQKQLLQAPKGSIVDACFGILDPLGKDGWELINYTKWDTTLTMMWTLKRPMP